MTAGTALRYLGTVLGVAVAAAVVGGAEATERPGAFTAAYVIVAGAIVLILLVLTVAARNDFARVLLIGFVSVRTSLRRSRAKKRAAIARPVSSRGPHSPEDLNPGVVERPAEMKSR